MVTQYWLRCIDGDPFSLVNGIGVASIGTLWVVALLATLPAAQSAKQTAKPGALIPFFEAVGISPPAKSPANGWSVIETPSASTATPPSDPLQFHARTAPFSPIEPFIQVLDRTASDDWEARPRATLPGVVIDPFRWRYQQERSGGLYKRNTKLDLPNPDDVWSPHAARNWTAHEKLHIPVPIPIPAAEQIFVYSQFDGSGDALDNQRTNIYGKTGIGVKWLLLSGSEVQVRYATLLSYADELSSGQYQERAQPSVEFSARMPFFGPLAVEYSGAAIPGLYPTEADQLKQELRLAVPLRGDNELEFGARYRWEYAPASSPWMDRTQIFLGLRLRR